MFKKKTTIVDPMMLPHRFNARVSIYDEQGKHVGWAQLWAEYENELYAAIEIEGWENNPEKYRGIFCAEYLNNKVVRQWALEEE